LIFLVLIFKKMKVLLCFRIKKKKVKKKSIGVMVVRIKEKKIRDAR